MPSGTSLTKTAMVMLVFSKCLFDCTFVIGRDPIIISPTVCIVFHITDGEDVPRTETCLLVSLRFPKIVFPIVNFRIYQILTSFMEIFKLTKSEYSPISKTRFLLLQLYCSREHLSKFFLWCCMDSEVLMLNGFPVILLLLFVSYTIAFHNIDQQHETLSSLFIRFFPGVRLSRRISHWMWIFPLFSLLVDVFFRCCLSLNISFHVGGIFSLLNVW